jgi:tetratricopeptide (TPR) repeat protein
MLSRWTLSRNSCQRRARRLALLACLIQIGAPALTQTCGSGGAAHAAEPEAVARARELYKSGEKAFKAGRYEEALHDWETGYQLSNRPLFLLNMGHAERRRGQLANARTLYKRFLLMEPETKLRGEIEGVLGEIDSTLAAEESGKAGAPAAATMPVPVGDEGPVPPTPAVLAAQIEGQSTTTIAGAAVAEAPRPVWRRWWFWAGAGTVVAAAVITTVLVRRGDSYDKAGSLGTLGSAP